MYTFDFSINFRLGKLYHSENSWKTVYFSSEFKSVESTLDMIPNFECDYLVIVEILMCTL